MDQWIKNAESMGSIDGLSKAICDMLAGHIHVLRAPYVGGMRERAMRSRGAGTIGGIDLAIAGLQRLKVLVAEETGLVLGENGRPTASTD